MRVSFSYHLTLCFLLLVPTTKAEKYMGFKTGGLEPIELEFSKKIEDIANPVFSDNGNEFFYTNTKLKQIFTMRFLDGNGAVQKGHCFRIRVTTLNHL
jgi:hypothetical protein